MFIENHILFSFFSPPTFKASLGPSW